MFPQKLLKCLLLLTIATLLPTHAFWWAPPSEPTTTATPPPLHLKEIPLTYFRTYTYQPMPGNPFAAFPYYHPATSALQSPLLAGTTRYEHAAYMHGSAYPINVAVPQHHAQQQLQGQSNVAGMLPQMYALSQQQPVLHVKPLQSPITTSTSTARPTTTSTSTSSSTTTTTTTTTTPAPTSPSSPPTTTPTSSTSTSTTTTSAPDTSNTHTQIASTSMHMPHQPQPQPLPQPQPQPQPYPYPYPHPTYNRRAYMGYNPTHSYRPAYPYPDYSVYKTAPVSRFSSHGGQIQFVPCMCPISVSSGGERHAALSPQLRSSSAEEEDLLLMARNDDMSLPAAASVGTEKSVQEKNEIVDEKNGVQVQQVNAKIGLRESGVTQNAAQQASTETVDVQLSAPKVEENMHDGVATANEQAATVL